VTCPVFMFCALRLVFECTGGVDSSFHVLRSLTRFRRYQGPRVLFSCFARPDSFSTVTRVSDPFFMFCAPRHVFGGAEGVGSCFHVLCVRTLFRRYRGRGSYFHVLRSQTLFLLYWGRREPFSCFAFPDSFSAVLKALCHVFMFCALELLFSDTKSVESRFHVSRAPNSFSAVTWTSAPIFFFCVPELIFGGTEGVGSHFHVLHSRTRFRQFPRRRVLFRCFAQPDTFSAIPWASTPVFMFCMAELIFSGTEGVGSSFHVLRAWTRFRQYGGRRNPVSCFARTN
jgi:hypothetical protein